MPPVISPPTQSEALPVTSMVPPFMYAPRCMPALPTTRMRPRVMPRPIHFTFVSVAANLDLVAAVALDVEEVVEPELPLAEEDGQAHERRRASAARARPARGTPPPAARRAVL